MKMEPEKFKQFMVYLTQQLKDIEIELLAYRMVFHGLKEMGFAEVDLDAALEAARTAPTTQKWARDKYDAPLEKYLKIVDESLLAEALERWLREWKPRGPVN